MVSGGARSRGDARHGQGVGVPDVRCEAAKVNHRLCFRRRSGKGSTPVMVMVIGGRLRDRPSGRGLSGHGSGRVGRATLLMVADVCGSGYGARGRGAGCN